MSQGTHGIIRTPLMVPKDTTPLLHRSPYMSPYKKKPWYLSRTFYLNLIRRSLAEYLATGLFVFAAVSASTNTVFDQERQHSSLQTSSATVMALGSGMAYAALMAATMHVSGGHMNPAVTVGVLLAGGINVVAAVCYFFAQVLGGITGAACVLAYESDDSVKSNWSTGDYGITELSPGYHPSQGILVELLVSLMVVMVFVHTTMEKTEYRPIAPLAVGFALSAGVLASYSITGGSMNPVRSFGPAVVARHTSHWNDHYIYWLGPLLGGILAGLFYRLFLSSKPLIPLSVTEQRTNVYSQ